MFKKTLFVVLAVFLLSKISIAGEVKKVEEYSFDLRSGGSVTVIGDEGSITVNSWGRNEVELIITKRVWHPNQRRAEEMMEELEVDIDHTQRRLYVGERDIYKGKRSSFWDFFDSHNRDSRSDVRIDYELRVPENVDLRIESDEGEVEIGGISGMLKVSVDEGNINLNDLTSIDIDVGLDEGNLECKNIRGKGSTLKTRVDEGIVRLTNCQLQTLDLGSDEGGFDLLRVRAGNCNLSTDEGDIAADLDVFTEGRFKIRTDEGDIRLMLPSEVEGSFRIRTPEGRIRSQFPLSVRRSGEDGEKVDDSIGRGSARFDLFTEEGNIYVEKK